MKKILRAEGLMYSLRPVGESDAGFILEVRLEDLHRNRFIHRIANDVEAQKNWIRKYLERDDDYYFVVHNKISGLDEGLIGLYDVASSKAEWGRWVLKRDSLAAVESLDLISQIAFDKLGLDEIFSRTIEDNEAVVSFHNSAGEKTRGVLQAFFNIDGHLYNAVEHYIEREHYKNNLMFEFQKKAQTVFLRFFAREIGWMKVHHIGVACNDFEREMSAFRLMGYRQESPDFHDSEQGIYGRFLIGGGNVGLPRLELLRNDAESTTLDMWIKNKVKFYHLGIVVEDFNKAMDWFVSHRAQIVRQPRYSTYFGARICFVVLQNMLMLEVIELQKA